MVPMLIVFFVRATSPSYMCTCYYSSLIPEFSGVSETGNMEVCYYVPRLSDRSISVSLGKTLAVAPQIISTVTIDANTATSKPVSPLLYNILL